MRYVLIFLSFISLNAAAEIRAVEGLKKLLKSSEESSAKNDFSGKCENLNKEFGPHEILRKVGDRLYLAAVQVCEGRGSCKWDDALVVETESTDFSGRTKLNKDLWVRRMSKKIKVKDEDGFDAEYAVMKENFDCAVEGSIHVSGRYAIGFAAKEGNLRLVKALVEKGQDINLEDGSGSSVLDIAQDKNRTDVVSYLKSRGAKHGKAKQADAFVKALSSKNIKLAKKIMRNGLDPNAKYDSAPVLYIAVRFGDMEMIRYLVDHGAKIDDTDDMQITPLIVAAHNGKKDAVQYLISKKADVNHIGDGGRSPASVAAEQGHNDIVKILKAAGAD